MRWSICIFARNEERLLPGVLGALDGAAAGHDFVAHVLENGSTDNTVRAALAIAAADPRIKVHQLAIGDKANAWNEYVHRIAPADADMHVFLDGDVRPCKGAFASLAHALEGTPEALAAAALPGAGRSRRRWAANLFVNRWLSGNLYAISGQCLAGLRTMDFRMPIGAVGEDGILSYALVTDLEGGTDDSRRDRIAIAAGAMFEFDSLEPNARDLSTYMRRLRRYSRRHFQKTLLFKRLKQGGLKAMPECIADLYTEDALGALAPRLDPLNFLVDLETLRDLRADAMRRSGG